MIIADLSCCQTMLILVTGIAVLLAVIAVKPAVALILSSELGLAVARGPRI